MGLQDDLAVVATGRALASAGLGGAGSASGAGLGERAGLFLAVGYIPFLQADIAPVLEASIRKDDHGMASFDIHQVGEVGFQRAHPLLTFRCLPNMPAYHVSVNFDIQGPYCVTYPGPAQLYSMFEEARAAIAAGHIDVALVGGVAAQSNFLVQHHFARIAPPVDAAMLRDAAAILVLESETHARGRGAIVKGRLASIRADYTPLGLAQLDGKRAEERINGELVAEAEGLGPAHLAVEIARRLAEGIRGGLVKHELTSRDGIRAESTWML